MEEDVTRRGFLGAAGATVAAATVLQTAAAAAEGKTARPTIKILGISCSFRQGRSTATAVEMALTAAKEVDPERVEVELIDLAGMKIPGAPAAGLDLEAGEQDDFPKVAAKLSDPNLAGLIVGTPVYFGNMSSLCKAFLERCTVFRKDNFALGDTVAGVVAVGGARNGGQELTIRSVQTALFGQNMIIVGEATPASHTGAAVWNNGEDVADDEVNRATTVALGRRVADVALRITGV